MKKSNIVKPTGLKGNDKLNRMRELMGATPVNEGVKRSVVELTKEGPDGKVYAIVRENHEYFIKVSEKKSELMTEDFQYIGGLQNKKEKAYPSYAKALKQLNLKFMSLNEAIGKSGQVNVFTDDNLITEHHPLKADAKLSATKGMGDGAEYIVDKKGEKLDYDAKEGKEEDGFGDNVADSTAEKDVEKVKLSETEQAIDSMITGDKKDVVSATQNGDKSYTVTYSDGSVKKVAVSNDDWNKLNSKYGEIKEVAKPKGFSIARAIQEMDEVIDSLSGEDEKIEAILESLGEDERAIMMEALKKKD